MLSIEHIMTSMMNGHTTDEKEYIAAVIFPDAIRAYTKDRELSHFEENPKNGQISYIEFPNHMDISADETKSWMGNHSKLADDIEKGPLGQKTHIETYREHNQTLKADNPIMYVGIDDHLKQDVVYDKYVRDKIGPDRAAIFKDEDHAIYVAAAKIYKEQGILCNKQWLEENIKPILEEKMPDLAENTFKYMHFSDPQYEKWVENADFTHLNEGPSPLKDYEKLYEDANMFMQHGIDPTKELNNVKEMSSDVYMINASETEIKPFAFENSDMKGLFIPDNVESIGAGAFDGCTEMEAVSAMSELLEKTGFEIFDDTNINQKTLADSIAEIKEEQDIADEDNSTEDIEEL